MLTGVKKAGLDVVAQDVTVRTSRAVDRHLGVSAASTSADGRKIWGLLTLLSAQAYAA